jgi:hypothetical protein
MINYTEYYIEIRNKLDYDYFHVAIQHYATHPNTPSAIFKLKSTSDVCFPMICDTFEEFKNSLIINGNASLIIQINSNSDEIEALKNQIKLMYGNSCTIKIDPK